MAGNRQLLQEDLGEGGHLGVAPVGGGRLMLHVARVVQLARLDKDILANCVRMREAAHTHET